MRISKFLFSIAILGASFSSIAATGSGAKTIDSVEVTDAFFTVYFSDGAATSDNCQQSDKVVFWKTDYPNGYSSMLSTALTAFSAGKKVTMWFNGCKIGPWNQTLPKADSIVITNL